MDLMVWVVTIALVVLLVYSIYTDPPSTGCLSADAARARDARLNLDSGKAREAAASEAAPSLSEAAVAVEQNAEERATTRPAAGVRNPLTGETAALPSNYRFAKKWIKEALVAEGLLDRVYRNSDLDDQASERVKAALKEFGGLTKYRV